VPPLADAADVAHRLTETEVVAYVLVDLAVIVAAARIVGWVFVRLHQPRVIGEIVAGILLGPTLLGGSVASDPDDPGSGLVNELFPFQAFEFLNLLATLALVFFMFSSGSRSNSASFADTAGRSSSSRSPSPSFRSSSASASRRCSTNPTSGGSSRRATARTFRSSPMGSSSAPGSPSRRSR
jgi:Sodium/hydrogen exchanger family